MENQKPTKSRELITPEQARIYLLKNDRSRPLMRHRVDEYAVTMARSEWNSDRGSIKLFSCGTIADGQHRLSAIVQANVTLELWVIRNFPENGRRVRCTWP